MRAAPAEDISLADMEDVAFASRHTDSAAAAAEEADADAVLLGLAAAADHEPPCDETMNGVPESLGAMSDSDTGSSDVTEL